MRKVLLISLSLVMALVGWSTVRADDGFYVIAGQKAKYAPVPKTGQTDPYGLIGTDGALQKGVAWPTPRFTDNLNGTVTDKLTGLIWMKDAGILGKKNWADAVDAANTLASGAGGLTDGSVAGDWRLPNVRELQSLIDYGRNFPALPENHPFDNVYSEYGSQSFFWSSTTLVADPAYAIDVEIGGYGFLDGWEKIAPDDYVWCVRGGR
jgi:Protein of unknown function (DUF1566)